MLARIIGNDIDGILFTYALTVKAVLTVLDIFEYRLFKLFIPTYYVNKACLIAKLAAYAAVGIKLYSMICVYHLAAPP